MDHIYFEKILDFLFHIIGAARNRDAVVVSANDERAIMKRGVKDSFSRRVKVVGVNYSDSGHNVHRQLSSYLNN
jgi:hypothetical protein